MNDTFERSGADIKNHFICIEICDLSAIINRLFYEIMALTENVFSV